MYTPTVWKDHITDSPHIFTLTENGDGTYTIVPAGTVIQQGTRVNAENLNHMESGIEYAVSGVDRLNDEKLDADDLSAEIVPYDNTQTALSADTVQEALDVLISSVCPTLTVSIDTGSTIVISNGSTQINGTADQQGKFTAQLPHTGTWSITATLGANSTSGSVNVEDIGKAYTLTLEYFSATLTVTTAAGASVTAVKGSTSYSAVAGSGGTATLTIREAGSYTVSATYDDCTSESKSVNVTTSGSSYSSTVAFMTLSVTAPSGSALTVTNGTVSKAGVSTGTAVKFYIPSSGAWTVTATKDGETATDSVSISAYQDYTVELAYVKIYGVEWDKTSRTTLSRTDDAALFTDPVPALSGGNGSSPFDSCAPWSGMVKETISGSVLVKIPKFWFKWTVTGSTLKLQIADKAVSGFHVSPAHADRGDGNGERDYVYIARYKCSSTDYKSVTGKTPKSNITRSEARTAIAALGTGFSQQDFAMFWTTRMLYLVEFANWNSQAAIGYNCGNNSAAQNTGASDSMVYHTGTMQASRTTYGVGVQYRWIEDPWGNVREWCDGIYFSGSDVYCINNPANFSDTSGGTKVGTRPTTDGYISDWSVPSVSGFEYALYPSAVAGSDSTYVADDCYYSSAGVVLYVGGGYNQNQYCGMFYLSGNNAATSKGSNIGARLQYLP